MRSLFFAVYYLFLFEAFSASHFDTSSSFSSSIFQSNSDENTLNDANKSLMSTFRLLKILNSNILSIQTGIPKAQKEQVKKSISIQRLWLHELESEITKVFGVDSIDAINFGVITEPADSATKSPGINDESVKEINSSLDSAVANVSNSCSLTIDTNESDNEQKESEGSSCEQKEKENDVSSCKRERSADYESFDFDSRPDSDQVYFFESPSSSPAPAVTKKEKRNKKRKNSNVAAEVIDEVFMDVNPIDNLVSLMKNADFNDFFDEFELLYKAGIESLSGLTSTGQSMFEIAIREGKIDVVELLMGAELFQTRASDDSKLLSVAVKSQNLGIVTALLCNPIFQNEIDYNMIGASLSQPEMKEILLRYKSKKQVV